jgi:hypothetical protein
LEARKVRKILGLEKNYGLNRTLKNPREFVMGRLVSVINGDADPLGLEGVVERVDSGLFVLVKDSNRSMK